MYTGICIHIVSELYCMYEHTNCMYICVYTNECSNKCMYDMYECTHYMYDMRMYNCEHMHVCKYMYESMKCVNMHAINHYYNYEYVWSQYMYVCL